MHRMGLANTVMVKDNHWVALTAGGESLAAALDRARNEGVTDLQVEVESVEQLEEAFAAGATRLLIDNQTVETVTDWVVRARRLSESIECEATGGISFATVGGYARSGVDFISLGALTHSVQSADISLEARS